MWFIFSMLSSVVLLQLSYWIMARLGRRSVNEFIHLGVALLGVFFFHPVVLLLYRKGIVDLHLKHPFYCGCAFAAALMISWLVTTLLMKFPKWSWIILGAVPIKVAYKIDPKAVVSTQPSSRTISS